MLGRSSIKNGKLEELANVTEYDVLTFRLLNDVAWLSKDVLSLTAFMRNY
jgi:hypothetical protein